MIEAPKIYHFWLPKETLGQRVRRLRKSKNYSQFELADQSGVSRNMIAMIEVDASTGSVDTLLDIAQALDLDLGTMIGGCDYPTVRARKAQL